MRWREDLIHVRPLTAQIANNIDDIFCHRVKRKVKKDGTISHAGKCFEVDYNLVGDSVVFVFDPQTEQPIRIESESREDLGSAVLLDLNANLHRKRQRQHSIVTVQKKQKLYATDLTEAEYIRHLAIATECCKEGL
jgi:hypothetical protein